MGDTSIRDSKLSRGRNKLTRKEKGMQVHGGRRAVGSQDIGHGIVEGMKNNWVGEYSVLGSTETTATKISECRLEITLAP